MGCGPYSLRIFELRTWSTEMPDDFGPLLFRNLHDPAAAFEAPRRASLLFVEYVYGKFPDSL
jgi:hypothetical protein